MQPDKDLILANEVTSPQPGQRLQAFLVRRPYETEPSVVLVDSEQMANAMATISAGVAAGNSDSAMSRAVRTRSYTTNAAACSADLPDFSNCFNRASNLSVPLVKFMGALSVMDVVKNSHRSAEMGPHPFVGGAA